MGFPEGSRQYDAKTVLTGYIHLATEITHDKTGKAKITTACGEHGKPYVWRQGGLRMTTMCSLVECPKCRMTDAYWDRVGDAERVANGKPPRWLAAS